ncbi:hypothetical protein C2G38_2268668 [Gigaspora rosea]|uniref:SbsA Ig-like domain-containing protein n=1 Tax=Gigaspora rosea TaxID=44941 RepID=A0A397UP37_9GLOM|nr:hypothetical protein C2G38_2268668 [Gigaspora rosea]
MKLSRYPYKLISQCTFLISLFILITPLKSQTTSSEITHISYSESTTGTSFPQSAPQVVNVQTYDDGIILVSVARQSYSQIQNVQTQTTQTYNSSQCTQIFENILRLRVIQLDGSIKEINPSLNLDPMNYCIFNGSYGNPVNPITIYTLYSQFILINYVKVDSGHYEEWGTVIDWNGNSLSEMHYGPSYTYPNGTWSPRSMIQLNINKKQVNTNVTNSFIITTIPTVTGDYALLSVNSSSISDNASSLATRGGLYMNIIPYNQSTQTNQVLLYQISFPNVTFLGLYCDIAPNSIGYICIIEISYNSTLNYMKVHFLTSQSVISVNFLSNIPDTSKINLTSQNIGMQAMTFGGYIYYAMDKNHSYFIWPYDENDQMLERKGPFDANNFSTNAIYNHMNQNNLNAAVSIMKNNTFIIASNTSSESTSWSLLLVPLSQLQKDNGYGNLQIINITPPPSKIPPQRGTVDSFTNALNITFNSSVISSNGSITIYKSSDNTMRQKISAMMSEYVTFMPNNDNTTTVSIKIIGSTFNQYGENYYVQMDTNFVKDGIFYEPLTGIDEGIVNYKSKNKPRPSDEPANYLVQLTKDASERFRNLADANKIEYFNSLLQDISIKLPVRNELLSINGYQDVSGNVQFVIRIENTNPKLDNNNTVPGIVSDLKNMIMYKHITTFSNGSTNDLDDTYEPQQTNSILGDYKSQIIPFIVVGIGNLVLYIYSQYGTTEYDKLKLMINVVTGGLFTASHTSFSSIFAFSNIGNHPELSVTSQVVLIFSISLNFAMFIWIMCKGGMKTIQTTNLITVLLSLYNAETLLAINEVKILEIFEEKYEHIVQYRSCADILIKNIPLLIIQLFIPKRKPNVNEEDKQENEKKEKVNYVEKTI